MEKSPDSGEYVSLSLKDEILRILNEDEVDKEAMFELIPELRELDEFEFNHPAHAYSVLDHSLLAASKVPSAIEKLALLFHDIGKPETVTYEENYMPGEPPVAKFHGHPEVGAKMALPILDRILSDEEEIYTIYKLIELHDSWYKLTEEKADEIAYELPYDELVMLFNVQRADLMTHESSYALRKLDDLLTSQKMIQDKAILIHENE
jgi:tRNA nucleotidyltransferase (CCA-adding enzyme)